MVVVACGVVVASWKKETPFLLTCTPSLCSRPGSEPRQPPPYCKLSQDLKPEQSL